MIEPNDYDYNVDDVNENYEGNWDNKEDLWDMYRVDNQEDFEDAYENDCGD